MALLPRTTSHAGSTRPDTPCAVARSRRSRRSRLDLPVRAVRAAPRSTAPTAARMAPWTTWSRSQPACSPATRRSRASNSPAPDPAERTRSFPTGISPLRPQTSTPSLETCRRSLRPWTRSGSNGSPWATSPCTRCFCAAPPRSNTSSSITRRTRCRRRSPVETRWPAINTHFWDWIWWLATKASVGRNDLVAEHMPQLHAQLLRPTGITAVPTSIESAIEAFVGRRNALETNLESRSTGRWRPRCARESIAFCLRHRGEVGPVPGPVATGGRPRHNGGAKRRPTA